MEYLGIGLFILYLAYKYDYTSVESRNKIKWYRVLFFILTLFIGLRYRIGLDTIRYLMHFYEDTPIWADLDYVDWYNLKTEPLYFLFVSTIKTFFGQFVFVQLFQAAFVNGLLFVYFKKHTKYIFTCVFFYYIWRFIPFTTEEMRASVAVAISLFANDYALEGKKLKSMIIYMIAFGFHTSSILLLFVPFITSLKFDRIGLLFLLSSFAIGIVIQSFFGDLIGILSFTAKLKSQADNYNGSEFSGQTLNIMGIISVFIVYFAYTHMIVRINKRKENYNMEDIEPFLVIGLFFVIVSISVSIMYRITRFFDVYFIILYAQYIGERKEFPIKFNSFLGIKPYLLFIPFLVVALYLYIGAGSKKNDFKNYMRIYPYESVISKNVDWDRERLFIEYGAYYIDKGDY